MTAFKSLRRNKPVYNNHLLFAAIIETFLLKVGEQVDQAKVFLACKKIEEADIETISLNEFLTNT